MLLEVLGNSFDVIHALVHSSDVNEQYEENDLCSRSGVQHISRAANDVT